MYTRKAEIRHVNITGLGALDEKKECVLFYCLIGVLFHLPRALLSTKSYKDPGCSTNNL